MRRQVGALAFVVCLAGSSGVLGHGQAPVQAQAQTGRARIVQMAPHTPALDVLIDGQRAVPDLPFRSASRYLSLVAGSHTLQLNPTGGTTPLLDQSLTVRPGQDQTIVALGLPPTVENLVLNDDNQSPAAGMAKVRFVHAGADVPAVDIAVAGGPTLFHNIGFKGVAGPIAVPVGTYTLQVRAAGTSTLLLLLPNIVLTEGQNLTLFGAGLRSDQTLTVVVLPYAPVASPLATDAAAAVAPTTPLPAVAGLSTTGTGGAVSARSGRVPWLALLSLLLLAGAGTLWHVARRY